MKLSAPKQIVFCISVILIVLGLIAHLIPTFPIVGGFNAYWITLAGAVLLILGNLLTGL